MRYSYAHIWLSTLAVSPAVAAPIEGELASNAASILVLLGLWALLMGMRNLRELRHKRLVPERRQARDDDGTDSAHSSDAI